MVKRPTVVKGDIAYIPLDKGQTAIIDSTDANKVGKYTWWAWWDKTSQAYYAKAKINGKSTYLHKYILNSSSDQEIDHKDGNRLNNKRDNLRIATRSENQQNRRGANRNSQSGIRGISKDTKSNGRYWKAMVGKESVKRFPYTDQGLKDAEQWVVQKRLELFTHSDGR